MIAKERIIEILHKYSAPDEWYQKYSELGEEQFEKAAEEIAKEMIREMKDFGFRYCQSEIEDKARCKKQCNHCAEYYAPLDNE